MLSSVLSQPAGTDLSACWSISLGNGAHPSRTKSAKVDQCLRVLPVCEVHGLNFPLAGTELFPLAERCVKTGHGWALVLERTARPWDMKYLSKFQWGWVLSQGMQDALANLILGNRRPVLEGWKRSSLEIFKYGVWGQDTVLFEDGRDSPQERSIAWMTVSLVMPKRHSMESADRWNSSPHSTPITQQREEKKHQRQVLGVPEWTSLWLPRLPGLFSLQFGTWARLCLDCECFQMFSVLGGGGAEACQAVIGMQANPCKGHIKHYLSLGRCLEVCWSPVAKGKENITAWWNGFFYYCAPSAKWPVC